MEKLVDVTGTMAQGVENWQQRTEALAKPEYWGVDISMSEHLIVGLTTSEINRLEKKVAMVRDCAKYMLAGMVKGTVKYTSDDWTLERWMAHMIGEGADQMNYQLLLFNKYHEEKQEKEATLARIQKFWKEEK